MATTTTNSAPTYDQLAWTSLGSAAASITFSSITGTYTDLRLILMTTATTGPATLVMQINSDTGTNYSCRYLNGNGTTATSSSVQNGTSISLEPSSGATTLNPQLFEVDFFAYTGSNYKTLLTTSAGDGNGSGNTYLSVGLWRNTSAITSITISYSSGNLAAGSTAALYGIKAA